MRRTIGRWAVAATSVATIVLAVLGFASEPAHAQTSGAQAVSEEPVIFVLQGVVYGVRLESGERWQITPDGFRVARAAASPDGSMLAFHTGGPQGLGNLHVINTDGTDLRQVVLPPHRLHEVFWDSAGDRIWFDSDHTGSHQISSYRLDDEAVEVHTFPPSDVRLIGARPGVLAYWDGNDLANGMREFVHQDPSTGQVIARRDAVNPSQAKLNADGSQAIYATPEEGVIVLDLGAENPRATTLQIDGAIRWPRLSPDGVWAAFSELAPGSAELVLIELADPSNRQVLTGPQVTNIINPVWLPDSSGLVYRAGTGLLQTTTIDKVTWTIGQTGLPFSAAGSATAAPQEPEIVVSEPCETDGSLDTDCDRTSDYADAFPQDPSEAVDTDGDGTGDNTDTDIDGDGHRNEVDAFPLDPYEWEDTDGDGIGDEAEWSQQRRVWNFMRDAEDAGLVDADGDGKWDPDQDEDGDGWHDLIDWIDGPPQDCSAPTGEPYFIGPGQIDSDGDGQPDSVDKDFDNDGTVSAEELDQFVWIHGDGDWDGDGIPDDEDPDYDGDGFDNHEDHFPYDETEWIDCDGGGLGDNSDPDDDDDGVFDDEDVFPYNGHEWADADGDGIGDQLDADDDNDGVLDSEDFFPTDPTEALDSDYDGIGNNADPDDDNDGVPDEDDAFPTDSLYSRDADGDGVGDFDEIRENNPELVDAIESVFGGDSLNRPVVIRDSDGLAFTGPPVRSEGPDFPWRLIRVLVVWPLIFYGLHKRRQSAT